jgi:hypothetical protein
MPFTKSDNHHSIVLNVRLRVLFVPVRLLGLVGWLVGVARIQRTEGETYHSHDRVDEPPRFQISVLRSYREITTATPHRDREIEQEEQAVPDKCTQQAADNKYPVRVFQPPHHKANLREQVFLSSLFNCAARTA